MALERRAFCARKRIEHEIGVYLPSLSGRTTVYKGMLTTDQLPAFFPDLTDERFASAIALVHSRFSTNTFPSWPLAHPYRFVAHNGEINTVHGQPQLDAGPRGVARQRRDPRRPRAAVPDLSRRARSDSASFDEVLELLHLGGRSLPHAVLMMIPEAWENNAEMDPARRAFYEFHSCVMEPWDGPACVAFTDGTVVGAVLDRNGLRPSRYWVTDEGRVVLASEVGVLDIAPERVVRKGRLQPGRMFLVDTVAGRIVDDDELKADARRGEPVRRLAARRPARPARPAGARARRLPARVGGPAPAGVRLHRGGAAALVAPMARAGAEAIGSMGTDTPVAVLSARPRLLFDYFTQLFAQVTNPPLDAIREELVTSLSTAIGPERNLLDPTPASCRQITLPFPVIDNDDLAKIIHVNDDGDLPGFAARRRQGPLSGRRRRRRRCATRSSGSGARSATRSRPAPG